MAGEAFLLLNTELCMKSTPLLLVGTSLLLMGTSLLPVGTSLLLQAELWLERHDSGDRDSPSGWGEGGMKEREERCALATRLTLLTVLWQLDRQTGRQRVTKTDRELAVVNPWEHGRIKSLLAASAVELSAWLAPAGIHLSPVTLLDDGSLLACCDPPALVRAR